MSVRCKFNHSHPPEPLKAATGNPTQPWGPRPYHCPQCPWVTNPGTVGQNWAEYSDAAAARAAGHLRACKVCFPTAGSEAAGLRQRSRAAVVGVAGTKSPTVTVDDLAKWRRQLVRLLDKLDNRATPGAGPVARITRMKNEGLIPRKTAALMIFLAEARNAAEYDDEGPTCAESEAVKNAWAAVVEWANARRFDLHTQ